MKKEKGFTIVELLAVIAILAVIITIASVGVLSTQKRIQNNMYCEKLENIGSAAKLYGQKIYDELYGNEKIITVKDLVDQKQLTKDSDVAPHILDPRNKSNGLDNYQIKIYIKNNRVNYEFLTIDENSKCDVPISKS